MIINLNEEIRHPFFVSGYPIFLLLDKSEPVVPIIPAVPPFRSRKIESCELQRLGHLADGGVSSVYRERMDNVEVATKVFERGFTHVSSSEIAIHQKLNHPQIVKLLGYVQDKGFTRLVFELMEGGNLHQYLESHTKARLYFKDIISMLIILLCGTLCFIELLFADGRGQL